MIYRVLGGEGSVTMTRMPFLVERAMITVLRACIHMLDREDMGVSKYSAPWWSMTMIIIIPANIEAVDP